MRDEEIPVICWAVFGTAVTPVQVVRVQVEADVPEGAPPIILAVAQILRIGKLVNHRVGRQCRLYLIHETGLGEKLCFLRLVPLLRVNGNLVVQRGGRDHKQEADPCDTPEPACAMQLLRHEPSSAHVQHEK